MNSHEYSVRNAQSSPRSLDYPVEADSVLHMAPKQLPRRQAGKQWPNLFIVGVPKAGTRSLARALGQHPDISMSKFAQPRYFLGVTLEPQWTRFFDVVQNEDRYLRSFDTGNAFRYFGDPSPECFFVPEALQRIKFVNPDARLLVVLRNPIERAYSHYLNDVREGIERRQFLEVVEKQIANPAGARWPSLYVDYGRYAGPLRQARELFGESLRVVFFEELVTESAAVLGSITDFLDLAPFPNGMVLGHENAHALPRNRFSRTVLGNPALRRTARALAPPKSRPRLKELLLRRGPKDPMDPSARQLLHTAYASEVPELEALLHRAVPWSGWGRADLELVSRDRSVRIA
jgi:sulfotransferase family protein